ncbi:MAG: hypothetical protein AB7P52_08180 [Alphaproteobacteria bacterium]
MREIAGSLSLGQWQRYARRLLARGRGQRAENGIIVARQMGSIYLRGLCAYRTVPDLLARDRLVVGCFAVPATIDCEAVARELIRACQSIAQAQGCRSVQFQLGESNRWITPLLREAGFAADRGTYVHEIAAQARA